MRKFCYILFIFNFSQSLFSLSSQTSQSIQICNLSHQEEIPFLAFHFFDDKQGSWVSRGWYPVPKGQCGTPLEGIKGDVYVYLSDINNKSLFSIEPLLEKSQDFCYHTEKSFTIKDENCEKEKQNTGFIKMGTFFSLKNIENNMITIHIQDKTGSKQWP